jgi:PleD family two-component response regulator
MTNVSAFAPGDALKDTEILYVDGEPHRRDMVRQLLITVGATRITLAESGADARRIFLTGDVGIVIAEQVLPDMSAATLIRGFRAREYYPKALTPMLVIGEAPAPETVRAALAAGANHFVVKPVTAAALYERMCWALSDARPYALKDGHYAHHPTRAASISPQFSATK